MEEFISTKLNQWGNMFGFVRFFDVKNSGKLEKEIDSIRIGSMKLHVNFQNIVKVKSDWYYDNALSSVSSSMDTKLIMYNFVEV